jgi:uncharacterized membrane protein
MSETPKSSFPTWMKVLLVGSLAVNLAVIGLVAGLALRGPFGEARPQFGPQDGLLAMQRSMPDGPRRSLGREFFKRRDEVGDLRSEMGELRRELPELLEAQPFDVEAVRANLEAQRGKMSFVADEAMTLFVDTIANMSDDERKEFAENLRQPPKRRWDRDREDRRPER